MAAGWFLVEPLYRGSPRNDARIVRTKNWPPHPGANSNSYIAGRKLICARTRPDLGPIRAHWSAQIRDKVVPPSTTTGLLHRGATRMTERSLAEPSATPMATRTAMPPGNIHEILLNAENGPAPMRGAQPISLSAVFTLQIREVPR